MTTSTVSPYQLSGATISAISPQSSSSVTNTGINPSANVISSLANSLTSTAANPGAGAAIYNASSAPSSTIGNLQLGLSAAGAANKVAGVAGAPTSQTSAALGVLGGGLSVYNGLQQGGVSGYGSAAVGALRAGSGVASLAGDSTLAGGLSSAAGYLAAPLALYNFGKNWQSGATGSDALNGAEAGAAIGSIIPGIGTVIGGLIGGAVGAVSSIAGGGKPDQESTNADALDQASAASSSNAAAVQQTLESPSSAFQYLAGIMDAKTNTPGHSQPIEQVFGREGETTLTNDMFNQINSQITSGAITPIANGGISVKTGGGTVTYGANSAPEYLYNNVVSPWLTSQNASINPNSVDVNGANEGANLASSLEGLIGSWQTGTLNNTTPIGVSGQVDTTLPTYGA
jgi:hypothetical protein